MVHYFVKEGLLLAIFCPFYCKKRVYYSLHFFLHKDYFGGILSKIGLRNALCTIIVDIHNIVVIMTSRHDDDNVSGKGLGAVGDIQLQKITIGHSH